METLKEKLNNFIDLSKPIAVLVAAVLIFLGILVKWLALGIIAWQLITRGKTVGKGLKSSAMSVIDIIKYLINLLVSLFKKQ